jgi:hypothetical protein
MTIDSQDRARTSAAATGVGAPETAHPVLNSTKSLLTHTVYGFGLYFAALATASLLAAGS